MLIDLFSSDLVAGYKEIVVARQALVKKWRFDLLRAYTQKRERYNQQLAQTEARKERYQGFLPFIGVLLAMVCGVGAWLTFRNIELACLGMSLMLGSGSSDTQLRIYDKSAEQVQKGKTPVGEWVRCEAQFRNERAQIAAQVLAAEGEGAIAGLIAGLVDFKEPGQDSNKARWKRCAWWSAFLGLVETIRLTVQPEDRSVEQVADWIKRQVGPSLSLLSVAQGYGSEWLLDLVEACFGRLREGHLRMLGMCRQPAPEGGW